MGRMMILAAALMLGGCAALDGALANRLACTVARDGAYVVSLYGPIGVASVISERDARRVCSE